MRISNSDLPIADSARKPTISLELECFADFGLLLIASCRRKAAYSVPDVKQVGVLPRL